MNRRIAMGKAIVSGCALALFGFLTWCASAALAQTCTPVVFAFRHAEDTNPPQPPPDVKHRPPIFHLTPTGEAHADLYQTMVPEYTAANGLCPVTKVYATTTLDKVNCSSNCVSATNAFFTGKPLANAVMSGADPIIAVGEEDKKKPENSRLYEYLGNGNSAPKENTVNYSTTVAVRLRDELRATANRGESSAIFWTSQGLHVLGGAITGKKSNIPDKNLGKQFTPPRNAAYIFMPVGDAPNISGFSDTGVPPSGYVQCFNHVEYSDSLSPKAAHFIDPTGSPPTQFYYCGYGQQANLGGSPPEDCKMTPVGQFDGPCDGSIPADENARIKGKICDLTKLSPDVEMSTDIFGACN
jgi:hypothetical protein